jgi:hypothetical protein
MNVFDPIVMKNGSHSEYCKCNECSGNAPLVVRCASFLPGGVQCIRPMYHVDDCLYMPAMPFSTHIQRS